MSDDGRIVEYDIPPVRLGQSGHLIGTLNLYQYQDVALEKIKKSESCLLEVHAGTGMGKTAVATLAALDDSLRTAMFVYPTNELIENQVQSIRKICQMAAVGEPAIVKVHAADLLRLVKEKELSSKSSALRTALYPRIDNTPKFVLTNPDTLHLIIRLRYGGKRRYGKAAAEILATLANYATLVIDEFHSYERRELASLYFDLALAKYFNLFDKILLMTATPHQGIQEYIERLATASGMNRPNPIQCMPQNEGMTVVHTVHIEIRPQGKADLLQIKNHLVSLRDELIDLRAQNPADDYIPACVILNSVIGARALTEMLLEEFDSTEIKESHGLIPQAMRRGRADALVLVGTSSIEVGIDFDTSYLLFEAWNASSALQRLGRVGRHRAGTAVLFAPEYVYNYFEKYVDAINSREEFNEAIKTAYGEQDAGLWYLDSPIARLETRLMIDELIRLIEATPAASSYAGADSLNEHFEKVFNEAGDIGGLGEWENTIRKAAKQFITLRNSEPQALVHDFSAERKHLFPAYFAPVSRILRRAMKFRVRGIDPKSALRPFYAIQKSMTTPQAKSTMESLISEYRLHYSAGRRVCVMDVYRYMSDKARYVKMSYSDDLPRQRHFEPIVGINEEEFLGTTIGFNLSDEGGEELDSLFVDRLYAIVDADTHRSLGWGLESYPLANGNTGARVYFDGSALVALAKYVNMNKE